MNYEQAPATNLLATFCACCSRPLVDAKSVEIGVGPECRRRHGYGEAQSDPDWNAARDALRAFQIEAVTSWGVDARNVANVLVHRIAVEQDSDCVHQLTNALRALGFSKLADRITHRLAAVCIEVEGDELLVKAPYDERFVAQVRNVRGRKWDAQRKVNRVPVVFKRDLWIVLVNCFEGQTLSGPNGLTVIRGAA